MNRQRGQMLRWRQRGFAFLPFLLANWQFIAGAGIVLAIGGYYLDCEHNKNDYKNFVASLKADQKLAEKVSGIQAKNDRRKNEILHNENANLRASNAALSRSLRDARSRANYLPPAAPGAKRPEVATFDRQELERAIQRLDDRVSGIIEKGDQARIDLDTARSWAK